MSKESQSKSGYAYKCGGIPLYPKEHSIFKKRMSGQSNEYIKNREKKAKAFLSKYGFDLKIDEN